MTNQKELIKTYNSRRDRIYEQLEELRGLVREHGINALDYDYAKIGDLGHVEQRLDELIAFLGGFDED